MNRATGRAASGFRPKLQSCAENLNLEGLDKMSGMSGHESLQGSRHIRFGPKLQSRAKSLSLESLDIKSGKFGHESRQGSRRIWI